MTPAQKIEQYAVSLESTQETFRTLVRAGRWTVAETKADNFIASITNHRGDRFSYELGRHNIELSAAPASLVSVTLDAENLLQELYRALPAGCVPAMYPQPPSTYRTHDVLAIPDERDASWVTLDGREQLVPLAHMSSVQFTIPTCPRRAIVTLNRLGRNIQSFLADYPQESVWRQYVVDSLAGYRTDRYGGPLEFESLTDYCEQLCQHDMVQNGKLVPVSFTGDGDIDMFLRSIWWYFRLRRHGDQLCIEVRPLPRRDDGQFGRQLQQIYDCLTQ